METILILICLPALLALIDFVGFLIKGRRVMNLALVRPAELASFLILPGMYISMAHTNNCCSDSTAFSPQHQPTIFVFISLCLAAYFYSSYRKKMASPVIEVVLNCLLLTGIVLNIFIAIQTDDLFLAGLGNGPILLLSILALVKNQQIFMAQCREADLNSNSRLVRFACRILRLKPLLRFSAIFILCLPLLVVVTCILLLAGQKPDSLIRAFTETYRHGFSQWDYKCENVQCGGHYLCSVAANGHPKIVKPRRRGIRNGHAIICNRQLLVSNAFEDLLQQSLPFCHKIIRRQYNKVGGFIHRHYHIFNNPYVSDFIYILMKPAEWLFLLILYTFDQQPENRIAKQYLSSAHRKQIDLAVSALK
jgi:hypothetical protein